MNRQFVVKMLQAKQLEYQALKEIIPEPVVNRIEKLEQDLVEIAKEYFYEAMYGKGTQEQNSSNESEVANEMNTSNASTPTSTMNKTNVSNSTHSMNSSNASRLTREKTKTRKVTIE